MLKDVLRKVGFITLQIRDVEYTQEWSSASCSFVIDDTMDQNPSSPPPY